MKKYKFIKNILCGGDIINYIVANALSLCTDTLIPALFPYMVAINLLCACGFDNALGRVFKKPFEALFHLPYPLASAYILGIIAGCPQGANVICRIYDKGQCSKEEAEKALAFCNNTGPAFIISGVGSMLGDIGFGVRLYLLSVVLTLCYGILTRPKKKPVMLQAQVNKTAVTLDIIPKAVTESVMPMLNICAFAVSFAILCALISCFGIPYWIKGFLYGLLELTNACSFLAEKELCLPLIGFAVGWSGLCIHAQSYSIISDRFSMKRYYIGKLVQSVLLFLILYLKNLF